MRCLFARLGLLVFTAVTGVTAFDAPSAKDESSKLAIRLVYAENFATHCQPQDSMDLFLIVKALLGDTHDRRHVRRMTSTTNDCSSECAWIASGQCSVMKPWYVSSFRCTNRNLTPQNVRRLAGPCNDWQNRRRELQQGGGFLSFVKQQDEISSSSTSSSFDMMSSLSTSDRCREAEMAVREALSHAKAVVTPSCQKIFTHPVEVTCFEGYHG